MEYKEKKDKLSFLERKGRGEKNKMKSREIIIGIYN